MFRLPKGRIFTCFLTKHYPRFVGWLLLPFVVLTTYTCGSYHPRAVGYTELTLRVANDFRLRMAKFGIHDIPAIAFFDEVRSNAVWENDTIRVGESFYSQDYLTHEDRLSILYHEYNHYLLELKEKYPCQHDLSGAIVQIETDILYKRESSPAEIEQDYKKMLHTGMTEEEKQQLWETASKPSLMRFRYAPSNLSREELHCYTAEVEANKKGYFRHSDTYAEMLHQRIKREEDFLKLRVQFEMDNGLFADGSGF